MAEENVIKTNIVATSNMSGLISDLNKVTTSLANLQQQLNATNKQLAYSAASMSKQFADTLRSTGQFSTHFVSLTSDVDKFGQQLDKGQLKLGQFFNIYKQHVQSSGGLIRQLAQQQVQLQNAILQPLGKNAQGLMQYNVHIPTGLDKVKNSAALARQELGIMNKVIQEGAGQLINWGKNTQWAGRQLTVGLTVPLAAFGKAAADAFRMADQELVRLTKVYGGLSATSSAELMKVRKDVTATATELSKQYGASFKDTLALAADIAATGKQGNELLGSIKETTRLSVLGEVDRQEAMKATLAIQTAFKQNTTELTDSINFLNAVENQTSTTLQDLVEAIPKAGPIIKGLGGNVQDLALYLTAMREGGVSAAEGANALKSALGSLINPTKVATNMFAGFGIDLKKIVTSNAGNLTATILDLQKALDTLNPLQKQQALEQLFGKFQFARMNALFSNLGKQGSQTLQVLDLMKASSTDLANIAGRELSQVTESASGKYRRALEGLKADLATVGDSFLKINTTLINVVDNVLKFVQHLPGPVKSLLSFFGMLTAAAGPLIMLTGVLGNFFGYIIKGISHFRSFFKGAEGWKLLTPEILAANKASNLVEQSMYSDARAAAVLNQALQPLIASYARLTQQMEAGVIHTNPTFVTPAGTVATPGRQVNPNSPYLTPIDTRHFAHMNPVSMMTNAEKAQQSIFGVVPGPQTVNQRIGKTPQLYMTEELPRIQGVTAVGKVSTGVVAGEAAKFHAMTGAMGMQTQAEIAKLRTEVARTGLITDELAQAYDALLPQMQDITSNAATRTRQIVGELQANKITADQARAQIIALNREIETMMIGAAEQTAAQLGRNVNVTQLPLLNQPAFDPRTGKANMKELFREKRGTRALLNNIARILGVKTYGASYSVETTIPKRLNAGGQVTGTRGNYGNVYDPSQHGAVVPGPNVNYDIIPANVPVGGFVLNQAASRLNPDLVSLAAQGYNSGGQMTPAILTPGETVVDPFTYSANKELFDRANATRMALGGGINRGRTNYGNNPFGTAKEIRESYTGRELAHLTDMIYTKDLSVDQKARLIKGFDLTMQQVSDPTGRVGSSLFAAYHRFFNQGTNDGKLPISKVIEYLSGKQVVDPKFGIVTHDPVIAYKAMMMDLGIPESEMETFAKDIDNKIIAKLRAESKKGIKFLADNPKTSEQISTSIIGDAITDHVVALKDDRLIRNLKRLKMPGEFRVHRPGKSSSARYFPITTDRVSTMLAAIIAKKRMPKKLASILDLFPKVGKKFDDSAIVEDRVRKAMRRGLFKNNGGPIGGQISRTRRNYGITNLGMPSMGPSGVWTGHDVSEYTSPQRSGMLRAYLPSMLGNTAGWMLGSSLTGGNMLGGLAGSMAGDFAATALMSKFSSSATGATKSASLFRTALQGIINLPGPVKIVAAVAALGLAIKTVNDKINEHRRIINEGFAPTSDTVDKLNLKYKSLNDTLNEAKARFDALRASGGRLFAATTSSGIPGINLTIKQLRELKDSVKKDFPELIDIFNKAKPEEIVTKAAQLKAQFVAGGMSAQNASNLIYALISQSNDATLAVKAIASQGFLAIKDESTAANYSIKTFMKLLSKNNTDQISAGLDQVVNSLTQAELKLAGTKDDQGNIITAGKAFEISLEKINKLSNKQKNLTEDQLNALKKQNPELKTILNASESLASVYSKIKLYTAGINIDFRSLSQSQSIALATAVASGTDFLSSTGGPFASLTKQIEKQTKASKAASTAALKTIAEQKTAIQDQIDLRQKEIDLIKKTAEERRNALDQEISDSNYLTEIKKKQLDYQEALASGDFAAAARAQLDIQQLTGQQQVDLAKRAITDKENKDVAAKQAEIESLQAQLKSLDKKIEVATRTADAATKKVADLQGLLNDAISAVFMSFGGYTDNEKSLIKEIQKRLTAGGFSDIAAKISAEVDKKTGLAPGEQLTDKVMDVRVTNWSGIKEYLKRDVTTIDTQQYLGQKNTKYGSGVGPLANLPGGKNRPLTTANGQLTGEGIDAVIKDYNLKEGDYFDFNGQQYIVKKANGPAGVGGHAVRVGRANGGIVRHYGPGGNVNGAGTSTSDSIPAMLSNGEYVIRASAVQQYGKNFFDGLNAQKFAGGGLSEPKYNVPTPATAMVNPMTMGYNNGGSVHRYDVGGLVVNAAPGQNERQIAAMVVQMLDNKNMLNAAKHGRSRSI